MKARVSPLELHSYFVTEIGCTANSRYDPTASVKLEFEDLQVTATACPPNSDGNHEESMWRVLLSAKQNVLPEKNSPYNFHITIQGWFSVKKGAFPEDKITQLIEITGSSILFGVAREMLRTVMATGPYLPLLLPSISFHPAAPVIGEKAEKKISDSVAKKPKPRIAKK